MRAGAGEGNVRIWGTSPESIDEAEDRDKWYKILTRLDIKQPPGDMVVSEQQALTVAQKLGYPVMVRPSFVLGGRAMEIVYTCVPCLPVASTSALFCCGLEFIVLIMHLPALQPLSPSSLVSNICFPSVHIVLAVFVCNLQVICHCKEV